MRWLRVSDKAAWPLGGLPATARRLRWEAVKAIRLPAPTVIKQADVTVLQPPKKLPGSHRSHAEQRVLPVVANRQYRRQAQGRVAGFDKGRPKAARLTPVQPDGRASAILYNRLRRRAEQTGVRLDDARAQLEAAS